MLMNQPQNHRVYLLNELAIRKAKNPQYSIRAFSKHLGISKTALSDILADKRKLSSKAALKISERLGLSPDETKEMMADVTGLKHKHFDQSSKTLSDDSFRLISDWYHYGILNLAKISKNKSDPYWIAKRLAISPLEARSAVLRLQRLGFLEVKNGRLIRTVTSLDTLTDVPSSALRNYHKQNLKLAETSIERDFVEKREFSSMVVATNPNRLKNAKKLMREFRSRLATYLECQDATEVYTLSLQLFPISVRSDKQ